MVPPPLFTLPRCEERQIARAGWSREAGQGVDGWANVSGMPTLESAQK